jgi:hypothetical protein
VKFVFVYILEAHAVDEWPMLAVNESIKQHKSIEERHRAACIFLNEVGVDLLPVMDSDEINTETNSLKYDFVLDNNYNDFNMNLFSWPTRYWVIGMDGRVAVKGMPEKHDASAFSLTALSVWLESYAALHL